MIKHPNGWPDFPAHRALGATVTRNAANALDVNEVAKSTVDQNQSGWTVLVYDPGVWHYFHFMEMVIWLSVIQERMLADAPLQRLVFAHPWDNPSQNSVQKSVLKAMYPGLEVLDCESNWPRTFKNVVVLNRDWATSKLNKFIEGCMPYGRHRITRLGQKIRKAVGGYDGLSADSSVLYVRRAPPRCLIPSLEAQLLATLHSRGKLAVVDFGQLPWEQQVRLVAAHDILVGVHGNGLTNALWMRPGSLVIELFPPGVHHYDYQLFAELCGLEYVGLERDNVFPAFTRNGPPYGHKPESDKPVDELSMQAVNFFLDLRTNRLGRKQSSSATSASGDAFAQVSVQGVSQS